MFLTHFCFFAGVIEFLEWAAAYDTAGPEMRGAKMHEDWMKKLSCPILEIDNPNSIRAAAEIVIEKMDRLMDTKKAGE